MQTMRSNVTSVDVQKGTCLERKVFRSRRSRIRTGALYKMHTLNAMQDALNKSICKMHKRKRERNNKAGRGLDGLVEIR